ncbi:hypothetical protein V8B97DRAFT_825242 [Scleroderma yunnanense]
MLGASWHLALGTHIQSNFLLQPFTVHSCGVSPQSISYCIIAYTTFAARACFSIPCSTDNYISALLITPVILSCTGRNESANDRCAMFISPTSRVVCSAIYTFENFRPKPTGYDSMYISIEMSESDTSVMGQHAAAASPALVSATILMTSIRPCVNSLKLGLDQNKLLCTSELTSTTTTSGQHEAIYLSFDSTLTSSGEQRLPT